MSINHALFLQSAIVEKPPPQSCARYYKELFRRLTEFRVEVNRAAIQLIQANLLLLDSTISHDIFLMLNISQLYAFADIQIAREAENLTKRTVHGNEPN